MVALAADDPAAREPQAQVIGLHAPRGDRIRRRPLRQFQRRVGNVWLDADFAQVWWRGRFAADWGKVGHGARIRPGAGGGDKFDASGRGGTLGERALGPAGTGEYGVVRVGRDRSIWGAGVRRVSSQRLPTSLFHHHLASVAFQSAICRVRTFHPAPARRC